MFASRSLRAISRPTSSIRSTPSTTSTSSVLLGARRWNSSDAAKQAEEEKINKAADKVDSAAEEVTKKVAELETQVKELKVRLCELELLVIYQSYEIIEMNRPDLDQYVFGSRLAVRIDLRQSRLYQPPKTDRPRENYRTGIRHPEVRPRPPPYRRHPLHRTEIRTPTYPFREHRPHSALFWGTDDEVGVVEDVEQARGRRV